MRSPTALRLAACAAALAAGATAQAASVTLTKLTGLTGDPIAAATAVYKGDLSTAGIGSFAAITIADASGGFGGATGEFTGFDLDAIKLSTTDCLTAACAAAAPGMSLFDFLSGVVFTPGTQRAPVSPKLFGTGPAGNTLDNAVADLGSFDGVSIAGPGADGFISLGDNGMIGFNLTAMTSTAGLFMYIGEVGDNGEVAGSNFDLLPDRLAVPEPETYALMLAGLGVVAWGARRRRQQAD
jgi:hypothetical protein